jgi:spore germination protein
VAAPVAKPASAPVYEHVLYPGETLDDVARQYGSSQQEIMKLNNITDPSSIKPGTKLLVPIPE